MTLHPLDFVEYILVKLSTEIKMFSWEKKFLEISIFSAVEQNELMTLLSCTSELHKTCERTTCYKRTLNISYSSGIKELKQLAWYIYT